MVQGQGEQVKAADTVNTVELVGRVAAEPEARELPSGDVLWCFRVVVPRAQASHSGRSLVDALECVAWTKRSQRSVSGWRTGDTVSVTGSLRRRFFGTGAVRQSRVEVEMLRGKIIRRADCA